MQSRTALFRIAYRPSPNSRFITDHLASERRRALRPPRQRRYRHRTSQPDSLHLAQCNLVLRPVVELGCSQRLMSSHLLCVLEPSVVLQVNRDAGCSPSVTSDRGVCTIRRRRRSPQDCPRVYLAGVPHLLKDIGPLYASTVTTLGSSAFRNFIPDHDSEMVVRLKRAGLVIFGKTHTPEFGLSSSSESRLFSATHNSWNLGYSAGGSSGGSAAAIAAGMVPMAYGGRLTKGE